MVAKLLLFAQIVGKIIGSNDGMINEFEFSTLEDEGCDQATHLLQRRASQKELAVANATIQALGVVDAIFSFGAPSTSIPAMPNLQSPDGCFQGLRTYTETKAPGGGRQVDAASIFAPFPHAQVATLALDWNQDSFYVPCPGKTTWPEAGAPDWILHQEHNYAPRLKSVTLDNRIVADEEPFATANKFVTLAYKAYDTVANTKAAIKSALPGWTLVERLVYENSLTEGGYDDDPVMVVQDSTTLDCAIVFTGTDKFNELFTSLKMHTTGYCGFDKVHSGYRDELWTLTNYAIWPAITSKLSKCNRVTCVGHSLGGAICDVFAGCVNSHRINDPDYRKLMWYKGTPELFPEMGTEMDFGTVTDIFTYGAPAASHPPLRNQLNADGCFKGLRVYGENYVSSGVKQVDAHSYFDDFFPHANVPSLSLHWDGESNLVPCGPVSPTLPKHAAGTYDNWDLHSEANYAARLRRLADRKPDIKVLADARKFVTLAFGAYRSSQDLKAAMQQMLPGWILVERASLGNPREPALLAQDTESLACAIVLPGDVSAKAKTYGTEFCGLKNVHVAYRNELVRIVQKMAWTSFADKLGKCSKVTCVGHSKGGALCELFAACVNSRQAEDRDFRRLIWHAQTPEAIPAVA